VIAGATDAAKAAGWDVKVVDTQASADQANAGMSSFAVQKVDAIMVLAFQQLDRLRSGRRQCRGHPSRELGRRDRLGHHRHNQRGCRNWTRDGGGGRRSRSFRATAQLWAFSR
jgi:DNA-binding LacI/PurR family transcriptional regulator